MKKQLFLGAALLAAISAFPQQQRRVINNPAMMMSIAEKAAQMNKTTEPPMPFVAPVKQTKNNKANRTTAGTWLDFTGSMNPNSVLVPNQRSLYYNEELNTVSFVHRKSQTYQANPTPGVNAASGVIVVMISKDGGATWDSTCIWNKDTTGRYPQGLVYNPSGNTNPNNAYVVGTGPALPYVPGGSGNWSGNFFTSKPLSVMSNSAGADQQFISNTAPFGPVGKVDFARNDIAAPANGKVYVIGNIVTNINGTGLTTADYRSWAIIEGSYASGKFNWTLWDTISFNNPAAAHSFTVKLNEDGYPDAYSPGPHMCWNEAGTVAYFWTMGQPADAPDVGPNSLRQPIVWKYDNTSGTPVWSLLPLMDFTSPAMSPVMSRIDVANGDPNAHYPLFLSANYYASPDYDGIVDANNNLHIFSTLLGVNDTVQGHQAYDINGEPYMWEHEDVNGDGITAKPYLFDFIYNGTSNSWKAHLVDSLETETPGTASGSQGYQSHPWSVSESGKPGIGARLQMSRPSDGKYILYSWTDSKWEDTPDQKHWNNRPDFYVCGYDVTGDSVFTGKFNTTKGDFNVEQDAYFNYASPKCSYSVTTNNLGETYASFNLPLTCSRNQKTLNPITNDGAEHDATGPLTHYYLTGNQIQYKLTSTVGIKENALNSAQNSVIYPNPAKNRATLLIDLKDNSKVDVTVMNIVGQEVKHTSAVAQIGTNNINIDLSGLSSGVYLVNVKVGTATSTKKLIVE